MNKVDLIARQFSRAEKKRFEHYVVTRVWHLLGDLSIKFVTQQYVTRPEGRALTDMFFPQFRLHIEGHHTKQIDCDQLREAEIINATGHDVIRIDVTKDIEQINEAIDQVIRRLQKDKLTMTDFEAWDPDAEQNPKKWIHNVPLQRGVPTRPASDQQSRGTCLEPCIRTGKHLSGALNL